FPQLEGLHEPRAAGERDDLRDGLHHRSSRRTYRPPAAGLTANRTAGGGRTSRVPRASNKNRDGNMTSPCPRRPRNRHRQKLLDHALTNGVVVQRAGGPRTRDRAVGADREPHDDLAGQRAIELELPLVAVPDRGEVVLDDLVDLARVEAADRQHLLLGDLEL